MNVVALVHLIAGLVAIVVSRPLIRGTVKMNPWYGIRIREAFESDARWYAINRYGGQLLFRWGIVLSIVAVCGLLLPRPWWLVYTVAALVPIVGGLIWVLALIYRHARTTSDVA